MRKAHEGEYRDLVKAFTDWSEKNVLGFRLEKKAQGCSFWSVATVWDRTAPTPTSETSTSNTNCRSGSGMTRMGAEVNCSFRAWKASWAANVHWKGTFQEARAMRGAATAL